MIPSGNYEFVEDISVATAADPTVAVTIVAGVHNVVFDEQTDNLKNDRGSECNVVQTSQQVTTRILRSTLVSLCEAGRAKRK